MTPRKIVVFRGGGTGQWYWRVASLANGKTLADGGEGYRRRADAVHGVLDLLGLALPPRPSGARSYMALVASHRGEYSVSVRYARGVETQASWTRFDYGTPFTEFHLEVLP